LPCIFQLATTNFRRILTLVCIEYILITGAIVAFMRYDRQFKHFFQASPLRDEC